MLDIPSHHSLSILITGYRLTEKLYDRGRIAIYRGEKVEGIDSTDISSSKTVVIKILRSPVFYSNELTCFYNHYTITKNLTIPGVIKPLELKVGDYGYALVEEDLGCISLRDYMRSYGYLPPKQVIEIALKLTDILHDLVQHRVFHKSINPSNILINTQTRQVWLTNFGLASLLPRENQCIQVPNSLQENLAYIAPEQTGRMNRAIDFRTDFYGLGVTFYELLSHRLPFITGDSIELIYSHLATIPTPPHLINAIIPAQLSKIVLKLMAKNAEDRYQTALGLKYDLQECLNQWNKIGEIREFELGQKDRCDRFIISDKLYGRKTEVKVLLDSFERAAQGKLEMILVAGFSGIGKTAVINEVYKPITRQKGYFIKGKCEQFNRSIPFSAFAQALSSLVKQLLTESDEELSQWKKIILEVLGKNAQVIIDVIPNLEIILGKQPEVPELLGRAAQNRFNLVFSKFIQAITTKEHPLVIFLDDLQWADSASLNLLKLLLENSEIQDNALLVIGAYRDNEVFPAHPLMLCLQEIEQEKVSLETITLEPLTEQDISCLVSDTLLFPEMITRSLSKLIYQKTQGNPFFTTQFLEELYEEGHISFNRKESCWQYDFTKLRQLTLTDNVVKFMVQRLQKLPKATQEVLKLAACIGNRFNLEALVIICEKSEVEITSDLWSALQIGLIVPETQLYRSYAGNESENFAQNSSVEYRFLHDRVQQAVYFLIDESKKQITHFRIGQLLLENLTPKQLEDKFFEVINQFNFGFSLIAEPKEKELLARLNLDAGKRAKVSTAYNAASQYLAVARHCLGSDSWGNLYPLTLDVYQESVETAYLNTDFKESECLALEALQHTSLLLDKVKIHVIQIQSRIVQFNFNEAIALALRVLRQLDKEYQFPAQPTQVDIIAALEASQLLLSERPIAELINLPTMAEPKYLAAMEVLASLASPCYMAFPAMMPLIVIRMVALSLTYGNASSSAFGYAMYGFLLCDLANDTPQGYQFGRLSLSLVEQSNTQAIRAKVLVITSHFINIWHEPIHQCVRISREVYQSCLESGDLEFAGYAAAFYCYNSLFLSKNLDSLRQEVENYREAVIQCKQGHVANQVDIAFQTLLNLVEPSTTSHQLIGKIYDERIMLIKQQQSSDRTGLAMAYVSKLMLGYIFEKDENSLEAAKKAEEYLDGVVAMLCVAIFHVYDSLISLRLCDRVNETTKSELLTRVRRNQVKVQHWANHAPENYLHKFYLVEAEYNRVIGNKALALENYEQAIAGAKENQYIQEEALANELAAKFYFDWGKEKVAAGYMQEAYDCYTRWGAKAKTKHLEQHYPELLSPILRSPDSSFNPLETLSSLASLGKDNHQINRSNPSLNDTFDLTAILQSAQTLIKTLELDELLKKLSEIILHNSGCDRIILALTDDCDHWQINVTGTSDNLTVNPNPSATKLQHPCKLINYVKNTQEIVLVNNQETDLPIIDDYLLEQRPKSILSLPLLHQGTTIGVLYLHSSHTQDLFNPERITVLEFLCSQASIAINNAQLFADANLKSKAIESSVDGMAILDDELFIYLNKRHLDLYGYKSEELIGKSWGKLYSPATLDYIQQKVFPILKETGKWSGEVTAQRKDGTTFSEEFSLFLLNDKKLICICRDISDRKVAEQSLINSENKFRTLVSNIDGAVYHCKNDADWTMEFLSNAIEDLSGYPASDFINNKKRTYTSIVHPDDLELVRESITLGIENHRSFTIEYRIIHKNGSIHWVTEKGKSILNKDNKVHFLEGVIFDISDRKIAEQSLVKSENKFRTLVGNIDGAVYRCENTIECKFDYISPTIFQLTGYSVEDFANHTRSYGRLIHPEDAENAFQAIKKAVENHKSFAQEYRVIHRDGSIRWVTERGKGIYNQSGEAKWLEGIIYDISDRKQLEQKQQQLNAILETTSDYIGICDPQGNIIWNNQRLVKLLNLPELEQPAISSFHPEWVNKIFVEEAFPNAVKEGTWSGETSIIDAEGREIAMSQVIIAHKDSNGEIENFSTIMRDISDRKATEQQLQKLSEKLELAIESAQIGIWELNLPDDRLSWNNRMFDIYGIKPQEFEGISQDGENLVLPEYLEQAQKINDGTTNFSKEFQILRPDGSVRDIVSTGLIQYDEQEKPLRVVGTNLDISDRKASEKALKRSVVRDKTIFDQASVGFIEIDISTQKFTRANNLFCQMTGYSAEELCEMKFQTLTHPDDLKNCLQLFEELRSGKTDKFFTEKRYLNKDGYYFWCETTAYPIEFAGESIKTVFGIIKDINDRKMIERQLEFTQYGLDHAADCFCCLDDNARIVQVNQAICERTGYTKKELLDMTIHDLAPTCPEGLTWKPHWEKLKRLKSYSFESVFQTATGEIFPVEVVCNYLEFDDQAYSFDLVRDITERRQAEEALIQQQNHLSALLDNIPHIAWIKDEQSRFIAVNQPFARACNTPLENIIGKTDYDVWPAELAQSYRDDDFEVLNSGKRKIVEERVALTDGKKGWLETTKTPFKNASGEFAGTVGIAADLTERKQAELALVDSEAKFRNLVENARDIIFSMTPEGIFTYISPQIEQILGFRAEQLIDQSCRSFVHPEDIFVITNWLDSLETTLEQKTKVANEKIRMPHIDGGWRWIVFSNTPVQDASGRIISIQGIGRDVTEAEQKRQALTAIAKGTAAKTGADFYQACVRYLTTIFQVKYSFFGQLNQRSSLKSTMLVLWNGQEFITSYDINLTGTPCLEAYKQQNSYIVYDSLSALFPEAYVSEEMGMESYAGVKIVDSQGQVVGNLGIMDSKALPKDSSTIEFILQLFATRVGAEMERQATEDALRKSQTQLQAFIDNSPSVIYQKDLKGRYQIVNQTLIDSFNFDRDTLVSQSDFELFSEDIAQQLRKNDQEVITSKNASTLEEVLAHPDGSTHTYIANKFPLLDDQGNPYALGGVSTDITEFKRAELALKESQVKFRHMTENVPGMIYRRILHPDGSHEFTYASSQIRQIYELEPETVIQNADHLWARIHPDDISRIEEAIRVSAETLEPFEVEHRLILPKKGLRWIQAFARAERLDNGDVIWDGLSLDITDRKLAEAKQQRQLTILETTSDFVGTSDPHGKILYLNEAWRNLLLRDGEEPYKRTMIAEQHPDWALEILLNQALPTATDNGMWSGETAILDCNGQEIPVSQVVIAHKSKDGEVEYFSTIVRDISDRKQAEAQLKIVSDRLEIAIKSAKIGIWEWDLQNDYLSWNDRMFVIYGVQPQDFKNNFQEWSKHIHPEDLDLAIAKPELLINQDSFHQEFRIIGVDGQVKYIFAAASILRNKQGKIIRWVGVNIDITERKLAEQKLQQTNEKLVRATRMKDEFLANMSHELRTPLNAILGMTEGLQEGIFGKLNPEQTKALNTIEYSGSHLLELIDDILDLTKIESGHVKLEYSAVEINQLCQSSLEFVKQQAQKQLIQLHLNTPFNLPNIRVDERRIRQVLINLLNNAVKFTPEGGSVTLEVNVLSSEKIGARKYLSFAIKDTGIGIAKHDIQKLFQPFVQIDSSLNRQYEGTGLGLFLVKRIIDLHHGNLTVTSKVGMGSCFTINLPYQSLADSILELPSAKDSTPVVSEIGLIPSPLILLAEDNSANSSIISTYLQAKGYRLAIAHNGKTAIELAQAEQPNLILMDIQMPGMDGLTAIKYIRQHFTTTPIPIIALTAFAMEEDRKKCLAAGANMYLAKPIRLKKLVMIIQKLLAVK